MSGCGCTIAALNPMVTVVGLDPEVVPLAVLAVLAVLPELFVPVLGVLLSVSVPPLPQPAPSTANAVTKAAPVTKRSRCARSPVLFLLANINIFLAASYAWQRSGRLSATN